MEHKNNARQREKQAANDPLISVVMPCFNAEEYLREAVDSVLAQTYPRVELIVVDDGSTDKSRDILNEYGSRIRVIAQANRGPYPARNLGVSESRGELLAFLDADDWWTTDCLEKLHAALVARPDAALAYCGWQNVGFSGGQGAPHVPPDYELEDKATRFLRAASPWPIHAALVRREAFEEVGGFDLDLHSCMDYDLWLRIAVSRPIVLVPEVMAFYRRHVSGQITSAQWRQARNVWKVKRKFLREHPELTQHLQPAEIRGLVDGGLLARAYDNFWRRDLVSAQKIFRMALFTGAWKAKDLPYLVPAWLPAPLYQWLINHRDRPAP
jgi:glycosyltransferase involved in cell wall biosynthesis